MNDFIVLDSVQTIYEETKNLNEIRLKQYEKPIAQKKKKMFT